MKSPIDVPTQATVAFVAAHVPSGAAVLEVGCGAGHVAVELAGRGYQVTGVDPDEEVVAQAQARGAPVVKGSWPDFKSAVVDAVVFTRSLHHIGALQKAVDSSRDSLRPAGTLLVEDFAFDEADQVVIRWFLEALGSRTGRALLEPVPGAFVTKLLASRDPVAEWHRSHDHDLHTVAAMTRAITERFIIREAQSVPYLYRYLVPVLPETAEAAVFLEGIFREEARLGELGEVMLIGRRLVGLPRASAGAALDGDPLPGAAVASDP